MDWLSVCHERVDCHKKRIIFKMEGSSEFIFEGIKDKYVVPIISDLSATKLIRQGCRRFMASVIDT